MKTQTLPGYGTMYERQHRVRNRGIAFISLAIITVCLVVTCVYQWAAQRDLVETTNRAILRQDSLEAVKLSQDRIIFFMRDTLNQLRKANLTLKQQTLKKSGK